MIPYVVHIVAGSLALLAGYVALFAAKGALVHRKSGMLFVYAMLVMAITGATIAAVRGNEGSAIGGMMTCYFVTTALTTVRQPSGWSRRMDVLLMVTALAIALVSLTLGILTVASPTKRWDGLPPFPFFMFGIVGLLAVVGDARVLRAGALTGAPRLTRHLWRMCWSLWIAAGSFFFGQAKVIPKPIRIPALLALPVLLIFVVMFYWLWRVRIRRSFRGIVRVGAAGAARLDQPVAARS
jgi:hypothetical protein